MKLLFASLLAASLSLACQAQEQPMKILFDVTSTDEQVHRSIMMMLDVMSTTHPDVILEVMVYGAALPMLLKGRSSVANEIAKFIDNDHVLLTACEVSMELLFSATKEDLLAGVGTVENALPDIVAKQHNGWGYIKVSN